MREDEIVDLLIEDAAAATTSEVSVRTDGGDQDVGPPEVIVRWNSERLTNENGHNAFGGYIHDQAGNQTGIEHHAYFRMRVEFVLRWYDEVQRDITADAIQMALLPYETESDKFHEDTAEWELEALSPRNNPVIEPDWYESSLSVSFKYVKRTGDTDYDTIEDVDTSESVDGSLDDITIDIN